MISTFFEGGRAVDRHNDHRARIVLRGERVDTGVGLAALARVLGGLTDALRAHARAQRGEPGKRPGAMSHLDEAVTELRLVGLEHGSVVLVLEPPPIEGPLDSEHLAELNFDALLRDIEASTVTEEVAGALESALVPLGAEGEIGFLRAGRSVVVDRRRAATLRRPQADGNEQALRIVGRLRALDLDRTQLVIRTAERSEWSCSYPEPMAAMVIGAIDRIVIATGLGRMTAPSRGRVSLEALEIVPEAVQTAFFDPRPRSIEDLRAAQGWAGEGASVIPDDAEDEEVERFLLALEGL